MNRSIRLEDFGRPVNVPKRESTVAPAAVSGVAVASSIRREAIVGGIGFLVLFGLFLGWAVTAQISGAVIAQGVLVVESSMKKIQSAVGGIVAEIRVADGARVEAGDVLIRFDDTSARANLAILERNRDALLLRQARLIAERDGSGAFSFSAEMIARSAREPELATLAATERRLFELRNAALVGKRDQLRKRIDQTNELVASIEMQIAAKERENEFLKAELETVGELFAKKLVGLQRINALKRDGSRLAGELALLRGNLAETRDKILETELTVLQVDQDRRSEVAGELRDVQARLGEVEERRVAALDAVAKTEIRAPQAGIVQQSIVHGPGAVVSPNEVIMGVVPVQDKIFVDVQVAPNDVGRVSIDQTAALRFSAFDSRSTGTVEGRVVNLSADRVTDARDPRIAYYQARVTFDPASDPTTRDMHLVPGMPVEVFITTESRNFLSYLVRPLVDQMHRAFRGA